MSNTMYAPGMRVEVRDAEWRIKRVDHSSDGGYILTCEGLSELVQGREALFLSELDKPRILDPRETLLVDDTSGNFGGSLLYLDSLLRKTAPSDQRLHLGHRAAIDQLDYQLQPALQALRQPRQRILIADAVGLGKTLEAGILTSELIARGRGKRILVLAVKSMLTQFQQEFWNRFTIPLVRLDSTGLQRVRNRIPANHNPFHYFDRAIISIDTLKQDIEYRHYLEQAYWDIIIIDEAHNVAERSSNSQRSRLAKLLATRSDTLIMLSATPHDGKAESFASLVNMLDPTAIANPADYAEGDFRDKGLVIRRFKKDVRDQLQGSFPEREIEVAKTQATQLEDAAYDRLMEVSFHTLDGRDSGAGQLFRTSLEKALFSSPAACLSFVRNRIARLQKQLERTRDDERATLLIEDIDALQGLELALKAITPDQFSKYQLLKDQITNVMGWKPSKPEDRLVIFTESIATLEFLAEQLHKDLELKKGQLAVLRGDMRDRDLMDTVEQFNRRESPIRIMVCSDVASEGINLHHLSHRMIHFDIPWSLMVFQQRNGRIDRYGQTEQPQIRYLLTESSHPKIRGDQRILEVLIEKDNQAGKNIGDPSEFLGLYDQQAEEEAVAGAMEQDDSDDAWALFESLMDGTAKDSEAPLDKFIPDPVQTGGESLGALQRVFPNGLEYARAALRWFAERGEKLDATIADNVFEITAPRDLQPRLNYLPRECRPEHDRFALTTDKSAIDNEIRRTRQEEGALWPQLHFLWPVHPVMEWLSDRALNAFGRHTAPVLRLPGKLAENEHIVLIHGGFPNRRGHVLIQDWVGVHIRDGAIAGDFDWATLQERFELYPGKLPNPGYTGDTGPLQSLLPLAVEEAGTRLKRLKASFESERRASLEEQQQRLAALKDKHQTQLHLELERSGQHESLKARTREERQRHIDRLFQDYQDWLDNTQSTEDQPYIQVAAVLTGQQGKENA
ncbi:MULTISPECIES: DEAD/DEAH box helicase [unclassified Microbulbifer]|uniref:DEAD/DEAH box helicase n=1 Tax=unclassified Microbulbifer TaxID=2619833 RepID=UPI0027E4B013|nr:MULTISPECIES: DEAD/DEAH box helicase [unclassified Microbulbifer]